MLSRKLDRALVAAVIAFAPAVAHADEKPAPKAADKPKADAKPADGKAPEAGKPAAGKPDEKAAGKPDDKAVNKLQLDEALSAAEKKGAAVVRTPAPELQQLGFLTGNFACDGVRFDPAGDHKYKSKVVSKPALDKFFVGFEYAQIKAKDHPTIAMRNGWLGWDFALKRFVFSGADNQGVAFLLRAEPASGEQIVFKGNASASFGRHVPVQWTFSKTAKGFDVLVEGSDVDGQLQREGQESCVKGR